MVIPLVFAVSLVAQLDAREDLAIGHLRAGQTELQHERWAAAAEEFGKAIDLDPLLDLAYYGLGQAHMGAREYDDAVGAFKQCRDVYISNEKQRLADAVGAERRMEDRIRLLQDYRQTLVGGQNTTYNPVATLNRLDNEIAQLQTMRKRHPMDAPQVAPFISTELGSAYFRLGNLTLAEAEWRNALKVDPGLGEVHNNLAVVCLMTNRAEEAADHVKQAEKAGIHVNPQLKQDIASRLR